MQYQSCAARRIGHQHRRDYTGESSTNAVLRRIGIDTAAGAGAREKGG